MLGEVGDLGMIPDGHDVDADRQPMTPRRPVKLKEDLKKIQEAILYVMSLVSRPTQYDIAKTLFLADRAHLNKYGRPITFDNYVAMEHGPVPSLAYDALKPGWNYERRFGEARPWLSSPDPENARANRYLPKRDPDLRYLSTTDLEELKRALGTVQSLSFSQLRRLTHEDPAYAEAWDSRGDNLMNSMLLPLLIERDGEARAEDLAYISARA